MAEPCIDVLLATRDGARFLADQLRSLERQTLGSWRLIALDDGSRDASPRMLEAFRDANAGRTVLVESPSRAPRGARRSYARLLEWFVRSSGAPYAAFCDQDDVWHPRKLRALVDAARDLERRHGEETACLVHCDLRVVDERGAVIAGSLWRYQHMDPTTTGRLNRLLPMNVVTGCGALVNRALARLAEPVPERAIMHDWWLALCSAALGRTAWIGEPLVDYRQHGENALGARRYGPGMLAAALARRAGWEWARAPRSDGAGADRTGMTRGAPYADHAQAAALLERFAPRLAEEDKRLIEAYVRLREEGRLSRAMTIARHGFWQTGVLRNIKPLLSSPG